MSIDSELNNTLLKLFRQIFSHEADSIRSVKAHASDRLLYRISSSKFSIIATFNTNKLEDEAFLALTNQFLKLKLPVPKIHHFDSHQGIILMQDLGNKTLYDCVKEYGITDARVVQLYSKVLKNLANFQIRAGESLDYSACYPFKIYCKDSIRWDLEYFLRDFVERIGLKRDEKLAVEIENFIVWAMSAPSSYFMYRDFQARNIMVSDDWEPWFIDYQNGRKGPLQYDVVSLLFQSRTEIPEAIRQKLLEGYLETISNDFGIDQTKFTAYLNTFLLLRMMQVLATYGKLGIGGGRKLFQQSIPMALDYLLIPFHSDKILADEFPIIKALCLECWNKFR